MKNTEILSSLKTQVKFVSREQLNYYTKCSLFNTYWKCLNLVKEDENYVSYGGIVNKMCEKFKVKELSSDMFKCLIFVQDLTANKDAEIHV